MSSKYTSEIVTLTPDQASEWLQAYAFDGQRPLRKAHVSYLANELQHGRLDLDQVVLCEVNGHAYLTDGQHRLKASSEAGLPLNVNLLRRKCANLAEVQEDYRRRDRGLTRSAADCYQASSAVTDLGLTKAQINTVAAYFRPMSDGFRVGTGRPVCIRSTDVRIEFIKDWSVEARAFFGAVEAADKLTRAPLQRAGVMSVALVTLRYQPEAARTFWSAVAHDDGLTKGMPEKAVIQFLMGTSAQDYDVCIYARYLAAGWNAKFDERELHQLRCSSVTTPIIIRGTPYDGREQVGLGYE